VNEATRSASASCPASTADDVGRAGSFSGYTIIEDHPSTAGACCASGSEVGKKLRSIAAISSIAALDQAAEVIDAAGVHVKTRAPIATVACLSINSDGVSTLAAISTQQSIVETWIAAREPGAEASSATTARPTDADRAACGCIARSISSFSADIIGCYWGYSYEAMGSAAAAPAAAPFCGCAASIGRLDSISTCSASACDARSSATCTTCSTGVAYTITARPSCGTRGSCATTATSGSRICQNACTTTRSPWGIYGATCSG